MYQAGDYIVYGTSGVCRVDEIKPSPFEGEEGRQYYTLTPVTGTETIYIPVDSPVLLLLLFAIYFIPIYKKRPCTPKSSQY